MKIIKASPSINNVHVSNNTESDKLKSIKDKQVKVCALVVANLACTIFIFFALPPSTPAIAIALAVKEVGFSYCLYLALGKTFKVYQLIEKDKPKALLIAAIVAAVSLGISIFDGIKIAQIAASFALGQRVTVIVPVAVAC